MLTAGNTPKHRLRSQKRAQLPPQMPITLLFSFTFVLSGVGQLLEL